MQWRSGQHGAPALCPLADVTSSFAGLGGSDACAGGSDVGGRAARKPWRTCSRACASLSNSVDLSKKKSAPASSHFSRYWTWAKLVSMMTCGAGVIFFTSRSTSMPLPPGMRMSRITTSGRVWRMAAKDPGTSSACPTTSTSGKSNAMVTRRSRIVAESSLMKTLSLFITQDYTRSAGSGLPVEILLLCRRQAHWCVGVCPTSPRREEQRSGGARGEVSQSNGFEWHSESTRRWFPDSSFAEGAPDRC